MEIEEAAILLNRIIASAYQDPQKALMEVTALKTPLEISFVRDAALTHIALLLKPARKPRTSKSKTDA